MIVQYPDPKRGGRTPAARAGVAVAAAMTEHDQVISGVVLLMLATLAWAVTSLPGLIVTALATVGVLLILAALDAAADAGSSGRSSQRGRR